MKFILRTFSKRHTTQKVIDFCTENVPKINHTFILSLTATAMHILKTAIYSKLTNIDLKAMFIGLAMDVCMVVGTYVAKYFIKKLNKNKFQKYVAVLLWIVDMYMLIMET